MLKGIDPTLTPDALHALCSMGHGDEVAIVDAHYPADEAGRCSSIGKVLRLDGVDTTRAIRAVLSVFPLDSFVPHPVERMTVSLPYTLPFDWAAVLAVFRAHQLPHLESVDNVAYERIVTTKHGTGWFRVEHDAKRHSVLLSVWNGSEEELATIAATVRRMFDLDADPAAIGQAMTSEGRRGAIRSLAKLVCDGTLRWEHSLPPKDLRKILLSVPGIGPWTSEYIAMRGFHDDDAFPGTDYGLKQELKLYPDMDVNRVRPWRAYAATALWKNFAAAKGTAYESVV